MSQGLRLSVAGVVIGLIAALALTRVLASLLYEVSAHDLSTFTLAPAIFLVTALLAAYLPARRATQVDPLEAMRHE